MPVTNCTDESVSVEVENPGTGGPPPPDQIWLRVAGILLGIGLAIAGGILDSAPLALVGVAVLIVSVLSLVDYGAKTLLEPREQMATPPVFLDGMIVRFCKLVDQQNQLVAKATFKVSQTQTVCEASCFIPPNDDLIATGFERPGSVKELMLLGSYSDGYTVDAP